MKISLIVAMTDEGVIGVDNHLPWRLPDDLKRFKQLTMGKPVIMGRKTFESIGRPLPGRLNIILTRDVGFQAAGVRLCHDWNEALSEASEADECFVIGGAELFKLALPFASRVYLTSIHHNFSGDVYFPQVDLSAGFCLVEESPLLWAPGGEFSYHFRIFERRKA